MSLRCLVIFCLVCVAKCAVIKSRNIPVEIVYDKSNPVNYGNRNLEAKIQLPSDELLKSKFSDEVIHEENQYSIESQVNGSENIQEVSSDKKRNKDVSGSQKSAIANESGITSNAEKNLNEKVQLSPEDIGQQLTFSSIPIKNEENEKSTALDEQGSSKPNNFFYLLKKAEEVAYSGINTIRTNAEKASQALVSTQSDVELWDKLNQTLDKFFKDQYRNINLKADQNSTNTNQNNQANQFWQSFVQNFQNTVNNFVGNALQQNNNDKPAVSEDEQQKPDQQNAVQNFFNSFSNGLSTIVNNINNLNNQNAPNETSGDTGEGSNGGGNVFNNVVSSIQQFFSGGGNQDNNPISSNQSDTGVQPPSNQGFFQGAINQFQGVIDNFRPSVAPTPSPAAPVQGDEGTASSSSTQPSNIVGTINQAFQSGNPLGQLTGATNPFPVNPQTVGGQISNQIGQFASGQGNPVPINPQTVGSEISNQIGQFAGGQQGAVNGQGTNPLPIDPQEIGTQIGSQFGQFVAGQGGTTGGSLDPQTIGSQIGNQIGQFAGGQGGPFQNIQNAISGSQSTVSSTEASKN